ncbi:hypothetical protein FXO37_35581 [Capsicum annuum]|nr:hypothetical protein FXO37_35581 [Capsicum annuum]
MVDNLSFFERYPWGKESHYLKKRIEYNKKKNTFVTNVVSSNALYEFPEDCEDLRGRISRYSLQSLLGGDIEILYDTAVEDEQKLTRYDRVMVYKFHDDNHGEIVSQIRRSDLEPYLGLHYPATDIP